MDDTGKGCGTYFNNVSPDDLLYPLAIYFSSLSGREPMFYLFILAK
jgi:hypothetical protein